MNFALATLWHERQRYLPGILAVAFSAVLIALTCGLLLGLLSVTSMPDYPNARRRLGRLGRRAERGHCRHRAHRLVSPGDGIARSDDLRGIL